MHKVAKGSGEALSMASWVSRSMLSTSNSISQVKSLEKVSSLERSRFDLSALFNYTHGNADVSVEGSAAGNMATTILTAEYHLAAHGPIVHDARFSVICAVRKRVKMLYQDTKRLQSWAHKP